MNTLNKSRKGITLAGGSGSRLFPLTQGICKQLLPVCEMAKQIKPSLRGGLDIAGLNALYLQQAQLHMGLFGRGTAWLDVGAHESLHHASVYVESIQSIQGFQVANLEEIAFRKGRITANQLGRTLGTLGITGYIQYLRDILQDPGHKNPNICAG